MVRTKQQIRSAKSKGSQHEMDTHSSLLPIIPNLLITKQIGYVLQFDLVEPTTKVAIECKFHKSITWNQAKKWFIKLEEKAEQHDWKSELYNLEPDCYLVYKSNQQPVLVMSRDLHGFIMVQEFEHYFNVPFIKHKSNRRR